MSTFLNRRRFVLLVGIAATGAWLVAASAALAAGPSSSITVSGAVTTTTTLTLPDLQALPSVTESVTYQSGAGPQSGTYTGPTLWSVLNDVGIVSPATKNGSLRQYVVVTGTDGYQALFSLGELNPNFGGSTNPDLMAYQQGGAPLGATGFARAIVPNDSYGGRYVSNVNSLVVGTAPSNPSQGGGTTSQFSLSGLVQNPGTYSLAMLEALPATTETVTYLSGGKPVTATFTGVSIWTLLTDAGIITDPAIKNNILTDYLLATGSDGYEAVLSLGELDPQFGGQAAPYEDLIAYEEDGQPLGADGFARLVVPGDVAGGRYVSNLVSLQVLSAVPEPGTLLLLVPALAGIAVMRRRAGA